MQPTFETDRLVIRPRTLADLEACLVMDRDPAATRFIPGPWADPVAHRAFVVARMEANYPEGLGYWSVFNHTRSGRFLGWILLLPYLAVADEVEIGWRFTQANWGHGFATEAAAPVLKHGLETVGLEAVVADIDPENAGSIRVAEKLGMWFVEDRIIDGMVSKSYRIDRFQDGR